MAFPAHVEGKRTGGGRHYSREMLSIRLKLRVAVDDALSEAKLKPPLIGPPHIQKGSWYLDGVQRFTCIHQAASVYDCISRR